MTDEPLVLVERDGAVAVVTLNRPRQLNALSDELMEALVELLQELDGVVDGWVESLARKLPQTTRYAKQQLNVWRDMAWHQTVGHARDWLALSMLGDEAQGAIRSFLERSQEDRNG